MNYKTLKAMYKYAQLYLERRMSVTDCKETREEYREEMEEITDLFIEMNDKNTRKKLNDARPRERYSNGKVKRYVQRW